MTSRLPPIYIFSATFAFIFLLYVILIPSAEEHSESTKIVAGPQRIKSLAPTKPQRTVYTKSPEKRHGTPENVFEKSQEEDDGDANDESDEPKEPPQATTNSNDKALTRCFGEIGITVPFVVVDKDALLKIRRNCAESLQKPITIAIDKKYRGKDIGSRDGVYVIYYEKPANSDFYLFKDDNENATIAIKDFPMSSMGKMSAPTRVLDFIFQWENGQFIECLGMDMKRKSRKGVMPENFHEDLAEFRDFASSYGANIILEGGTLLGWYRECALIPHTTDVDISMRASEYTPALLYAMEDRNSPYDVFRLYGLQEDSFEIGAYIKGKGEMYLDLFLVYNEGNTSWVGGFAWYTRKKYKWIYPKLEKTCAGALKGKLFFVPCDVEKYLETAYGEWRQEVQSSNFVWYESHKNIHENGKFTEEDMKKMWYQ